MNDNERRAIILQLAAKHSVTVVISDAPIRGFQGSAAEADGRTLTLPSTVIDIKVECHELAHAAVPDTQDGSYECTRDEFCAIERDAVRRVCDLATLLSVVEYHASELETASDDEDRRDRPRRAAKYANMAAQHRTRARYLTRRLTKKTNAR